MYRLRLILAALLALVPHLPADDWPQFLGPDRNNISRSQTPLSDWPKSGPPKLWQYKVGTGWAGPVVADGRVVVFHRSGDREIIDCLDGATGKSIWTFKSATDYVDGFGFDNGPRSTPAIYQGVIYAFGADANLHAVKLVDGQALWSINLKRTIKAPNGFFGLACSPIVHDGQVLLNIGAPEGAGVVAIDATTGQLRWKSVADEASYASPVTQRIGKDESVIFVTRKQMVSLDPRNGRAHFKLPFSPAMSASVSASTPLIADDIIFTTASYGAGAKTLKVTKNGTKILWENDASLSCQYHTPLLLAGHLYGFHGRLDTGPRPEFRCVELATGAIKWRNQRVGAGALIKVGEEILNLTVDGQLLRGRLSPAGYRESTRVQVLGFEVRAHPAFADGRFFARDKTKLVCLKL